ncbi:MAG: carbohydrate ABC transporter permease [Thermotogae bacterium]|nr:carbohydrate ABC transporter permease [Thermotogota bacterium]
MFILTIPKELEDAARIDGASSIRYLTKILIPLSKTMIGSVIVINFVYAWNFYLWPLVVINSNTMQTAQIGLQMLMTTGATRNWGIITAGTIIVLAPILILFFAVQNLFVQHPQQLYLPKAIQIRLFHPTIKRKDPGA